MKTQYESPEMRVHLVQLEMCILSNGQNLNNTQYGSRGDGEDTPGSFWG